MGPQPAARTTGLTNPVMRTFQSVLSQPDIMSFGAGLMNPAGFDIAGVRAAFATALSDEHAPPTLRISISNHTPETIEEGLRRLAAAVADVSMPAGAQR